MGGRHNWQYTLSVLACKIATHIVACVEEPLGMFQSSSLPSCSIPRDVWNSVFSVADSVDSIGGCTSGGRFKAQHRNLLLASDAVVCCLWYECHFMNHCLYSWRESSSQYLTVTSWWPQCSSPRFRLAAHLPEVLYLPLIWDSSWQTPDAPYRKEAVTGAEDAGLETGTGGKQPNPLDWIRCSPLTFAPSLDLSFTSDASLTVHFKNMPQNPKAIIWKCFFGKSVTNEQTKFWKKSVVSKSLSIWQSVPWMVLLFRSWFLL